MNFLHNLTPKGRKENALRQRAIDNAEREAQERPLSFDLSPNNSHTHNEVRTQLSEQTEKNFASPWQEIKKPTSQLRRDEAIPKSRPWWNSRPMHIAGLIGILLTSCRYVYNISHVSDTSSNLKEFVSDASSNALKFINLSNLFGILRSPDTYSSFAPDNTPGTQEIDLAKLQTVVLPANDNLISQKETLLTDVIAKIDEQIAQGKAETNELRDNGFGEIKDSVPLFYDFEGVDVPKSAMYVIFAEQEGADGNSYLVPVGEIDLLSGGNPNDFNLNPTEGNPLYRVVNVIDDPNGDDSLLQTMINDPIFAKANIDPELLKNVIDGEKAFAENVGTSTIAVTSYTTLFAITSEGKLYAVGNPDLPIKKLREIDVRFKNTDSTGTSYSRFLVMPLVDQRKFDPTLKGEAQSK